MRLRASLIVGMNQARPATAGRTQGCGHNADDWSKRWLAGTVPHRKEPRFSMEVLRFESKKANRGHRSAVEDARSGQDSAIFN